MGGGGAGRDDEVRSLSSSELVMTVGMGYLTFKVFIYNGGTYFAKGSFVIL